MDGGREAHQTTLLRGAIRTLLREGHLEILGSLRNNPSKRDSTGHLSKAARLPYMTTKRYIQDLCRIGAVKRCGGRGRRSCCFELTEMGESLARDPRPLSKG